MARTISIRSNGTEFSVAPVKIERSKIYGWSHIQAITPEGQICTQGGVSDDGITIVDAGCTKIGLQTSDGLWMDRSGLVACRPDGKPSQFIKSSFDSGIDLSAKATVEDLLDLNVQAVYQLVGSDIAPLSEYLGCDIYRSTFSYRGGYDPNDAFILSSDNQVYIITGKVADFSPIGISQEGVLDAEQEEIFIEDDDNLDFTMM